MAERAKRKSEPVYVDGNVINVYWNVGYFDDGGPSFSLFLTRKYTGWFGYVKQKTTKIAEFPYFIISGEGVMKYLELCLPLIRRYAVDYNADIVWEEYLWNLVQELDDKTK